MFVYLILLVICFLFTMGFILQNAMLFPPLYPFTVLFITVYQSDLLLLHQIILQLCFEGTRDMYRIFQKQGNKIRPCLVGVGVVGVLKCF